MVVAKTYLENKKLHKTHLIHCLISKIPHMLGEYVHFFFFI